METGRQEGTALATRALAMAARQIGVREEPPGSNRGAAVERFLVAVGLPGGYPWCAAFVVWCFAEAARALGVASPLPPSGGCLDLWARVTGSAPCRTIRRADALRAPERIGPGCVFVLDLGGGHGHMGFVRARRGLLLDTIEGNTNPGGSANGVGVFALSRRRLDDRKLRGILDFTDPV